MSLDARIFDLEKPCYSKCDKCQCKHIHVDLLYHAMILTMNFADLHMIEE